MASSKENDDVPMLPVSDTSSSRTKPFTSRSRSISLANTSSTIDVFNSPTVALGYTDPVGTQRQPPLVQISDPLASTRSPEPPYSLPPPYTTGGSSDSIGASSFQPEKNDVYNRKVAQIPTPRVSSTSDSTLHNALNDEAKGWARRFSTSVNKIWNPDSEYAPLFWTKISVYSGLLSIFVDPLFFFSIEVNNKDKCIQINRLLAAILVTVRSLADLLFWANYLLQLRFPYVAPESTVVGAGQLVDDPIKIARRYQRRKFIYALFLVIPIPQIMILWIIPNTLGPYKATDVKNVLRIAVLSQCILKLKEIFPLLAGQRTTGFVFESALGNFFINLVAFILAGHVVGSFWYLFGLQRVNHCLGETACNVNSSGVCKQLIVCGREKSNKVLQAWRSNVKADACFKEDGWPYGVYSKAVNLTCNSNLFTRYSYSLFWGFQQISTLAGNQVPSYFVGDILFTMIIIGVGLLLVALLIGNMQNFLLGLGRRNMEMILRRRDVKQWMSYRRLPEDIIKRVQDADRFSWTSTRGFTEELLFENMPDDIQRDIRRHLYAFLKNVRIFSKMDEPILDAIRQRLKQRIYLKDSLVLRRGDLVNKIIFIERGNMERIGEDGSRTLLLENDVCGEQLLTWYQERSSGYPDGTMISMPSKGLFSDRDVWCVTNVEGFSLNAADLEDVVNIFPNLKIPKEP